MLDQEPQRMPVLKHADPGTYGVLLTMVHYLSLRMRCPRHLVPYARLSQSTSR
jgi:hypothetical protein